MLNCDIYCTRNHSTYGSRPLTRLCNDIHILWCTRWLPYTQVHAWHTCGRNVLCNTATQACTYIATIYEYHYKGREPYVEWLRVQCHGSTLSLLLVIYSWYEAKHNSIYYVTVIDLICEWVCDCFSLWQRRGFCTSVLDFLQFCVTTIALC